MPENLADIERALQRLTLQAQTFARDRGGVFPMSRLGLITTLYFKQGNSPGLRARLADCFGLFYDEHRSRLGWQRHGYKAQCSLTSRLFVRTRQQVVDGRVDLPLQWSLHSALPPALSTCSLSVVCPAQGQASNDLSCLHMVLPLKVLSSAIALKHYQRWVGYFASQLRADHGYSGLACLFAQGLGDHLRLEFRQAQRYPGLMVDPHPHIDSLRVFSAIKGANWYTILGEEFIRRLGGNDAVRAGLSSHREVFCTPYDKGLIVRAGSVPELGSEGVPPPAYCAVNRVIRPVRLQETGSLHPCSFKGQSFCPASTAQWYARFDDGPPPMLITGQRCSRSGYWFSTAMARSRRCIEAGAIMPGFSHQPPERTQWFWDGEGP